MLKDHLRSHIIARTGRIPDNLDEVVDSFRPVKASRNTVLVETGAVCRDCYFIVSGCLKVTTIDRNGTEATASLAFEDSWCTAIYSFVDGTPSNQRIQAVEPCDLLAISRQRFKELDNYVPTFRAIYSKILEESYSRSMERIQTLMSMDALDRVKWLLEEHPLIFSRLSNRLIASYLGMSEATLSRLKAKL